MLQCSTSYLGRCNHLAAIDVSSAQLQLSYAHIAVASACSLVHLNCLPQLGPVAKVISLGCLEPVILPSSSSKPSVVCRRAKHSCLRNTVWQSASNLEKVTNVLKQILLPYIWRNVETVIGANVAITMSDVFWTRRAVECKPRHVPCIRATHRDVNEA